MAWQNHPWQRTNKYKAKRSEFAGRSFASQLERDVYAMLLLIQKAGEIKEIRCQHHIYLTKARIGMIPDYEVTLPDGSIQFHEAKGMEGERWLILKKLWKFYGPGKLTVWKRRGRDGVYIHETITPEI